MGSQYGLCTKIVRWAFTICNFIFLAIGAVAFGIGVWGVVIGTDYAVITGDSTVSAAALLLVGGIITFAMASIGIIGACFMWRPLLIIYSVVVVFIIILEFVATILILIFVDEIADEIRDNMEDAIEDYRLDSDDDDHDSDVNNAVENVQDRFECCGVDNATDWVRLNPGAVKGNNNVPPADCQCDLDEDGCFLYDDISYLNSTTSFNFTAWEDGCLKKLEDNLKPVGIAIGVLAIIFAVLEIILVLMALSLCCCIYSSRRQSVV